eukprot:8700820-Pyramimonas_sp.AAC.1
MPRHKSCSPLCSAMWLAARANSQRVAPWLTWSRTSPGDISRRLMLAPRSVSNVIAELSRQPIRARVSHRALTGPLTLPQLG